MEIGKFFRHDLRDLWSADVSRLSPLTRLQVRCLRLAVVAGEEFRQGVLSLRAMGLVYATLLSLVPFLAVMFSLLKAFGAHQQIEPFLAQALAPLGPQGGEISRRVVEFVNNLQVGVLGTVGVGGLFLTAISLIGKIEDALNHIWRVRRARSLARKFSDYLSVVLVGPVLVFTAFALTASARSHWLVQQMVRVESLGLVVAMVTRVTPFFFLCTAFTFLYKFVPNTQVRFRSALLGGAIAGILWQLAGVGFAAFVANSARYTAIYSGFAVLIIFPIWLYVGWLIVLVGGEVAYFHQYPSTYLTWASWRGHSHLSRARLALSTLAVITRRHLTEERPWRLTELSTALNVPPAIVEDLVDEFVRRGILFRTVEPEGVVLGRLPEHVTVSEILDAVDDLDLYGSEAPAESEDPVLHLLRRRDHAIRRALEGITLQSLTAEARTSDPNSAAPIPAVPLK